MTTSPAPEMLLVTLTPFQRDALVELIERAEIRGKDAPLVVGILRQLARAEERVNLDAFIPARDIPMDARTVSEET